MNYKDYYNQEYVEKYAQKEGEGRIEKILENIEFNRTQEILDVGCGNGFLAMLIADKVHKYIGIDISKEFINDAKERVTFRNCSFKKVELRDFARNSNKKFDLIFLLDVTEHVPDYDLLPILKDCIKLLKPKGQLVMHTPNKDYFMEFLKDKGFLKQTWGHIAVRNPEEYKKILSKSGFRKVTVKKINHYNKILKKLYFLSRLPLIGKLFQPRLLILAQQ